MRVGNIVVPSRTELAATLPDVTNLGPKLVIAADVAPRRLGSFEHLVFATAEAARTAGADVSFLFTGRVPPGVARAFDLSFDEIGAPLPPLRDSAANAAWIESLAAERADVYWLHFVPGQHPVLRELRRRLPQARIYVSERVSRPIAPAAWWKAPFRRWRARRSQGVVDRYLAVSKFVARRLTECDYVPADRVQVIYNGVNLARFDPNAPLGRYVTAVAYLRPEKGIGVLLRALALLAEQGFRPPTRIAGDGPELWRYQQEAWSAGLDHIEFTGENRDVPGLMAEARLCVVPSVWSEAFGFAAAEALAAGRPCIASDTGGLREIVHEGECGRLVPPGDAEALAQSIRDLYSDPEECRRMGETGRRRVETHFNLARQSPRLVSALLGELSATSGVLALLVTGILPVVPGG